MGVREGHLRRLRASYVQDAPRWRTQLSLGMDGPATRPVQPPAQGAVVAVPDVGGLPHPYERMAA